MFRELCIQIPQWILMNRFVKTGLYYFCRPLFALEEHKIERITSNVIAGYHGVTTVGMMVIEANKRDIFYTYESHSHYEKIVAYSLAYFVYDMMNDIRMNTTTPAFLMHHGVSIFSGVYLYSIDLLQLYIVALFVELSSLNLNVKDILDILEKKDSTIYTMNGVMFASTFFISRILSIPLHVMSTYTLCEQLRESPEEPYNYLPLCLMSSFTSLNVYWFQKIVKIAKSKLSPIK